MLDAAQIAEIWNGVGVASRVKYVRSKLPIRTLCAEILYLCQGV